MCTISYSGENAGKGLLINTVLSDRCIMHDL